MATHQKKKSHELRRRAENLCARADKLEKEADALVSRGTQKRKGAV